MTDSASPLVPSMVRPRAKHAQLIGMAGTIIGLHTAGWGILLSLVLPGHFGAATAPIGIGLGITAYTLGMRHAFDADHIAAIDNVTRRMSTETGRRAPAVGFFFSLGHSTVVFALALVLAFGLREVLRPALEDGSLLHHLTGMLGAGISGVFLVVVGILNVVALVHTLQSNNNPQYDGPRGGLLSRAVAVPMRMISRARHMYPVGILFGMGFDTATEIGLLVIAASSSAAGLPWYGALCLPILFASGMVLFDTLDGVFVSYAYSWALTNPGRQRRYNIAVTSISVVVAFALGATQISSSLSEGFEFEGPLSSALAQIDSSILGVGVAIALTLIFLAAIVVHRVSGASREPRAPAAIGGSTSPG